MERRHLPFMTKSALDGEDIMNSLAFSSAIAIATALVGAQASWAQEPQQAEAASTPDQEQAGQGLADIIVTAQKRAEPLQSVPVSVSAFSNDTLQKARVDGLTGLRGLVPGMTVTRSGAAVDVPSRHFDPGRSAQR
jgi:iron complex outermembrane recepter protein